MPLGLRHFFCGAGGAGARKAVGFHHLFRAEQMVAVAYQDATVPVLAAEDFGAACDGLSSAGAFDFGEDVFDGDTFAGKIMAADFRLSMNRVAARATGGDEPGGEALLVEMQSMVETAAQDGGGAAVPLRGAEHDDDVGRLGFVNFGLLLYFLDNAKNALAPEKGGDQQSACSDQDNGKSF